MTLYKSLASTYNKDLQEDKRFLFDSFDQTINCLKITSKVIQTLTINADRMLASCSQDMLATDLAEYLVRRKVPFREAHHAVGKAVLLAENRQCPLSSLSLQDFKNCHSQFGEEICKKEWWDFQKSVESRSVFGGTSRAAVSDQISQLEGELEKFETTISK